MEVTQTYLKGFLIIFVCIIRDACDIIYISLTAETFIMRYDLMQIFPLFGRHLKRNGLFSFLLPAIQITVDLKHLFSS